MSNPVGRSGRSGSNSCIPNGAGKHRDLLFIRANAFGASIGGLSHIQDPTEGSLRPWSCTYVIAGRTCLHRQGIRIIRLNKSILNSSRDTSQISTIPKQVLAYLGIIRAELSSAKLEGGPCPTTLYVSRSPFPFRGGRSRFSGR